MAGGKTGRIWLIMEQYAYKKIEVGNLSELVFLINAVGNKRLDIDYLRKKYDTPWAKGEYFGWLACDKSSGRAVAAAVALPLTGVLPDGRRVSMMQMVDTQTLPAHRGRGLMTRLMQLLLEDLKNRGTQLFFALANQNSVHVVVREQLGFTVTLTMECYLPEVATFPFEALCRKLRIPGLFRWWAEKVIAPFLASGRFILENSALAEGYGGVLHDPSFFAYKSFSFNRPCYFSGIGCWLKFESGLLVGDVLLPADCPDSQFDEWLSTLNKIARRMGLRKIVFQTWPQSRLSTKLSARYPARPSWALCCRAADPVLQPYLEKLRFVYGDFDSF